jgi:hypothetical protein
MAASGLCEINYKTLDKYLGVREASLKDAAEVLRLPCLLVQSLLNYLYMWSAVHISSILLSQLHWIS